MECRPQTYEISYEQNLFSSESATVTFQTDADGLRALANGKTDKLQLAHVRISLGQLTRRPERYEQYQGRLFVMINSPDLASLLDAVPLLQNLQCICVFTPDSAPDAMLPMAAASLGIPVHLQLSPRWAETTILETLDYFLYGKTVSVPVEPFYSLAVSTSGREEMTFWHINAEMTGFHLYVDALGRVSLSRRWAEKNMYFGMLNEPVDKYWQSEFAEALQKMEDLPFIHKNRCSTCPNYRVCKAFWATFDHADEACRIWNMVMDQLAMVHSSLIAAEPKGIGHA
jgi:radical SAM protein with 4Fe4S-binding SPASM domain